jgi:hypothetical protein
MVVRHTPLTLKRLQRSKRNRAARGF